MESSGMAWANFEQLRLRYYESTRAPWAAEVLGYLSDVPASEEVSLERLLTPPGGGEGRVGARRRPSIYRAVDDLLSYYGLVEIASIAGCMPEPLPSELSRSLLKRLSLPALVSYCRKQNRLLPLLLKSRLEGEPLASSVHKESGEGVSAFAAFLDVNAFIEGDPDFETFVRYLSGGEWEGYDLNDLISLTRRPGELLRRLAKESEGKEGIDPLDKALHGFRSFLIFSHRLDALLRSCPDDPILRSAFWHFHSERFAGYASALGTFFDRVLENFSAWTEAAKLHALVEDTPSGPSPEESLESLEELRWTISRLTSDFYGRPLWNALEDDGRPPVGRGIPPPDEEEYEGPSAPAPSPPRGRRPGRE